MSMLIQWDVEAEAAAALSREWGWSVAGGPVGEMAALALRLKQGGSAEALVELGALSAAELERRLERKPADAAPLEWLAQTEPGLRAAIEKVSALRAGLPYYDPLTLLAPHPAMRDEALRSVCETLDAVLMCTEDQRAVLVLAQFGDLRRATEALRSAPISAATAGASGGAPLLAVSRAELVRAAREDGHDEHALRATIARQWGWSMPGRDILTLAGLSSRLRRCDDGEALVQLGLLSKVQLAALEEQKPAGMRTLEWYAQSDPRVRSQIEKVSALRTSYAYYDTLDQLASHSAMQESAVLAKCYELDAALMLIEDHTVVLVFSAYADMLRYVTAGREERMGDVIRKHAGLGGAEDNLLVAVGKRDQVIARLAAAKGKDVQGESNIVAMWYGANAVDKAERMMARILDHALSHQVTDIAISPERGAGSVVEMRRLRDMVPCPVAERLSVEEAAKIVDFLLAKSGANPNLARVREPRDGNIIYRSIAGDAEMRLSFIPMNQPGEYLMSVSIRLMARTETKIELERLGLDAQARAQIAAAAKMSKGFILVVGGTNTGKSTTVGGALEENYRHFGRSRKRLSLEKPVERLLRGVTQINVPATMEDAFDRYLEAFKRHDPDIIFVGEILGSATANAAVTAAISGHLVFSTTHANDAMLGYDSVAQMLDANKRYQFIESLSLIVAQDMVRDVCQACGQLHAPTAEERELFEAYCEFKSLDVQLPEQTMHIAPDGCKQCGHSGIAAIMPINEVLPVTQRVKNAMFGMLGGAVIGPHGENRRDVIAEARTSTLFESAMRLVRAGRIELGDAIQ